MRDWGRAEMASFRFWGGWGGYGYVEIAPFYLRSSLKSDISLDGIRKYVRDSDFEKGRMHRIHYIRHVPVIDERRVYCKKIAVQKGF